MSVIRHGRWLMADGKWWKRHLPFAILLLPFAMLCGVSAQAVTSNGTGNWSAAATWNPATVPTSTNTVTIRSGDTVTIDISTATASTTPVTGTLEFSTVANHSFTVAQ